MIASFLEQMRIATSPSNPKTCLHAFGSVERTRSWCVARWALHHVSGLSAAQDIKFREL
jgi:hypothetical protein